MPDDVSELTRQLLAELSEALVKSQAEASQPITLEEIASLSDPESLRNRVVLRLLERFGSTDTTMTDVQRRWLATDALEAEWANGGLDQFVENQGDTVERTLAAAIEGYEMLGSPAMARVANDALQIIRSESEQVLRTESSRQSLDDTFTAYASERLSELDRDVHQMDHERAAFVHTHPSDFVG